MVEHLDPNYYGASYVDDHTIEYDTLSEARESFRRTCDYERYGDPQEHTAWIFFYDPRKTPDPYPDRIMTCGPRGGIRTERA